MPRKLPQFVICKLCGRTFRAVSWSHLHYAHGKSGSHPIREYKRHFRLRHAYSPATRKLLGDYSIERARKRGRHWTRERIVAEIRELAAAGHVVHWAFVKRRHRFLFEAAKRVLKTFKWADAIRAAGLDPKDHWHLPGRWTKAKAKQWVRRRHARGGRLLAVDAPRDLVHFVHQFLGKGWVQFVEEYGMTYSGVKQRRNYWNRQTVIEELLRWKAAGHSIQCGSLSTEYPALSHQIRTRFTSWYAACRAAGIDVERPKVGGPTKWTRELVLRELRRWTQEGHPVNYNAVDRDYCSLAIYARKFFGSWDAACIAAGIGVQRLRPGPKRASGKQVRESAPRAGRNPSRS